MADRRKRRAKLKRLSDGLIAAQKPIRVLSAIAWPDRVRARFLKARVPKAPTVVYPPLRYDPKKVDAGLRALSRDCDREDPIGALLWDTAEQYRRVVAMLQARGTPAFTAHSRELYGASRDPFLDGRTTNLQLAKHLARLLPSDPPRRSRTISADAARSRLQRRFDKFFGPRRVSVSVSGEMTADAAAGAARLRLRRDARFDEARLAYLEQHEGYIHIATTLNGRAQPVLRILGKATPRVVRYNEGLAVFAEWASGTLTPDRLRSLAERVVLNDLAENGASFMDLYQYLTDRGLGREDAYEQAHRVFRGGDPAGGSFFTKDTAYLDHFMRALNLFRVAMRKGAFERLELLLAGKVAFEDLPALAEARRDGLLAAPKYLPPWMQDSQWLEAHLALSSFLNRMKLDRIAEGYEPLIEGLGDR